MVTLADLRARSTLPSWQESVAILQELLVATVAERGSAARLPDVGHIGLTVDGTITLLPHSSIPENPVRHLAALLGVMLESVPAPAPLLDLTERNLKDPPELATPDELSRELRFFERPGRIDDIKDLVARAEHAREQQPLDEALRHLEARAAELLEAGEIPDRHVLERDGTVTVLRRERPRLPAIATMEEPSFDEVPPTRIFDWHGTIRAIVIAVTLAFAAYWIMRHNSPREVDSVTEQVAEAARRAFGEGSGGAAPAPSSRGGGSPSAGRPPMSAPPPSANAPPAQGSGSTGGAASSGADGPASSPDAAGANGVGTSGEPSGPSRGAPSPGSSPVAEGAPDPATGQAYSGTTYSGADADVTPPEPLGREAVPPAAGAPSATYDLVIAPTGTVEQVRLIGSDDAMRESMMRAHLKSWRFRPATKDGQPVRYQMQVRVAI